MDLGRYIDKLYGTIPDFYEKYNLTTKKIATLKTPSEKVLTKDETESNSECFTTSLKQEKQYNNTNKNSLKEATLAMVQP